MKCIILFSRIRDGNIHYFDTLFLAKIFLKKGLYRSNVCEQCCNQADYRESNSNFASSFLKKRFGFCVSHKINMKYREEIRQSQAIDTWILAENVSS